jgi:hypothetical protein
MVMGTSPASSEIHKRIRTIIKSCPNAVHIKDDIIVHGQGKEHDGFLRKVLQTLSDHNVTLRPDKCELGKPEVKWFGNIYSKEGMSPDPEKCSVIRNWPAPKSCSEVKSFLQTVQFNSKFLGGNPGEKSYPELTEPLRELTKKNAHFIWGHRQNEAFEEIQIRLCSNRVLAPFDTSRQTRMYVDSSPVGTQATIAQLHKIYGENVWRPVNHTSRAWTTAEAGYSQIERESNGILTGMFMNKMYTLGTQVEVVTDHEPLVPIYNSASKPRKIRVNCHRTKLLPFQYSVTHEPGKIMPCDYGSRHPELRKFSKAELEDCCVDDGTDIHVNRILSDNLPQAITVEHLRRVTSCDKELQLLIRCIKSHDRNTCKKQLSQFHGIFDELKEINGLVIKGSQIILQPHCKLM